MGGEISNGLLELQRWQNTLCPTTKADRVSRMVEIRLRMLRGLPMGRGITQNAPDAKAGGLFVGISHQKPMPYILVGLFLGGEKNLLPNLT